MTHPVDPVGDEHDPNADAIDAQFEPAAPNPDHVPLPEHKRKGPGWLALLITGCLAAFAGGALGFGGNALIGSQPPSASATVSQDLAALQDKQARLESRLAALGADLERATTRLTDEIKTLSEMAAPGTDAPNETSPPDDDRAGLSDEIAALSARIDVLSALPAGAADGRVAEDAQVLADRLQAYESTLGKIEAGQKRHADALATLANIPDTDGLEARLAELETRQEADQSIVSEGRAAGRAALAMLSLQAASDIGAPFTDGLIALERADADARLVNTLRPIAAVGAPTLRQLSKQFTAQLDQLTKAQQDARTQAALQGGGNGSGWLGTLLGDSVKITRSGDPEPEAALARAGERILASLAASEPDAALAALDTLPDDQRAAFQLWRVSTQRRIQLDTALAGLRTSLLAQEP